MNILDSIWWHKSPAAGSLSSSHIGMVFCGLLQNGMIVPGLAEMEFDSVPSFDERKLSPVEYSLAYIDGVIYEEYVIKKYRKQVAEMTNSGKLYEYIAESKVLSSRGNGIYTLKDSWQNVDTFSREMLDQLK